MVENDERSIYITYKADVRAQLRARTDDRPVLLEGDLNVDVPRPSATWRQSTVDERPALVGYTGSKAPTAREGRAISFPIE